MKKLLFIFGTRPEAIKMAPLILRAQEEDRWEIRICLTAQHREMVDSVLEFFGLIPHWDLDLMKPSQSLFSLSAKLLLALEEVLQKEAPDLLFVQGDTTTAFIGALSAFYKRIPIAHIEAGLRSHRKYSPYPEEINRQLVSPLADFHFAPTQRAKENLTRENIPEDSIYIVGNTVVDALFITLQKLQKQSASTEKNFPFLRKGKKLLLVTGHRRESFGEPFKEICHALKEISLCRGDLDIVYPVHLNPQVQQPVYEILESLPNIHLMPPLNYPSMVWLMNRSDLILTDSGGIQEEAPSLGKPVLVMREVTERTEGIEAGTCKLVGANRKKIVGEVLFLLDHSQEYNQMAQRVNPYGDGKSSEKILEIIAQKIG